MGRKLWSLTSRCAVALACVIGSTSCTTAVGEGTVGVTATYRERVQLEPGAVLEVSIEDVSVADAPVTIIANLRVEDPGSPPYRLEIPFDVQQIDERRTYAVRATIRTGGALVFTTDTVYPVLTRGAGREVEVLLRRAPRAETSGLGALPATFTGRLPCASCPGIDYHLDLFNDGVFYLRRRYVDRRDTANANDIGIWELGERGDVLVMWGAADTPTQFSILDGDTLRLLDPDGQEIRSSLSYELHRAEEFSPSEPSLYLRGLYGYTADTGFFEECQSGRRFAVALEADNAELERQYLALRREPSEALVAEVQGRLVMRPPIEGDGLRPTLIVDAAEGIWPGESCGARTSHSDLVGTNWVLTRLGDAPVVVDENQRPARLVLSSTPSRVSGFAGCNDFSGDVEITDASIRFGALAATMRACPDGTDIEDGFLAALRSAARFNLLRHHLELSDENGAPLARFEARELE